ncbi:MAG: hypothetical protein IPL75_15270 [Acidobacteria bacterium]|nr:hypothetical protein [Acidobacteriota bacterium]
MARALWRVATDAPTRWIEGGIRNRMGASAMIPDYDVGVANVARHRAYPVLIYTRVRTYGSARRNSPEIVAVTLDGCSSTVANWRR